MPLASFRGKPRRTNSKALIRQKVLAANGTSGLLAQDLGPLQLKRSKRIPDDRAIKRQRNQPIVVQKVTLRRVATVATLLHKANAVDVLQGKLQSFLLGDALMLPRFTGRTDAMNRARRKIFVMVVTGTQRNRLRKLASKSQDRLADRKSVLLHAIVSNAVNKVQQTLEVSRLSGRDAQKVAKRDAVGAQDGMGQNTLAKKEAVNLVHKIKSMRNVKEKDSILVLKLGVRRLENNVIKPSALSRRNDVAKGALNKILERLEVMLNSLRRGESHGSS